MCYRRADNLFLAGRLKGELGHVFGDQNVFYDIDSIRAGSDFREVIRETLDLVDVVVALVGSEWDPGRLTATNDPVYTELREALEKRKLLIPVLVGNTVMPQPEQLPAELEKFAFLHAVRVRPDPDFQNDSNKLITEIMRGVGGAGPADSDDEAAEPVPSSIPERRGVGTWFTGRRFALIAVSLAAAIILAVVLATLNDDNTSRSTADESSVTTAPPPTQPPPVEIVVDGTQPWTDTGIDLSAGDRVQVTAAGVVFHNEIASTGPDGFSDNPNLQGPLGSANHSGLIGRISEAGAPFLVGSNADFTADRNGRLYFGINDVGLSNNSGAFGATVTVTHP